MSLSTPTINRKPMHTRTIEVEAFLRDDGLWDLEAHLRDVKPFAIHKVSKPLNAHQPLHDMRLRVTIDDEFTVVAAEAVYEAAPYDTLCYRIAPEYQQLVGLNLLKGFRHAVRERLGKTSGCTHITELTAVLPTVAIQARVTDTPLATDDGRPFQIDSCHALKSNGEVVLRYYPRWYTGNQGSQNPAA